MLFNCHWSIVIKLMIGLLLLIQVAAILTNPTPNPQLLQLTFMNKQWLLYKRNCSEPLVYETIRIIIHTKLFFLLELQTTGKGRLVIIFSDQINDATIRQLKLYEKCIQV
ncbi:hypothetical protein [Legionella jamestowniensis]|uniref:Uncharacterized protein n=2 Tax=Legionella jamestowniensis TaxID=455 RepID=A0A0W0UJS3_9GAMM|nr:hypothetical protein [Legionella jamestowniensis]KTD08158.1 hypothetical protein Ljam_2353 [Legionella jamestowniensis]SFL99168.1 hypothetical protein SAMN02746073_2943 [Legionella jamestowniensis DSM 19215]